MLPLGYTISAGGRGPPDTIRPTRPAEREARSACRASWECHVQKSSSILAGALMPGWAGSLSEW